MPMLPSARAARSLRGPLSRGATLLASVLAALLVFLAGQAAPAAAQGAEGTGAVSGPLRPGDLVRINVWGDPAMSGDFPIAGNGTIQHPIYQEIVVTGIPAEAVQERVRTLLSRLVAAPQFVVQPLVRVAVGGQVRQPNVHLVPIDMTISDAIMLSGGVSEVGRIERVRLLRGGQEMMLDLTNPDMRAATMRVQSGDQIIVMRRRSVLFDVVLPVSSVIAGLGSIAVLLTQR